MSLGPALLGRAAMMLCDGRREVYSEKLAQICDLGEL